MEPGDLDEREKMPVRTPTPEPEISPVPIVPDKTPGKPPPAPPEGWGKFDKPVTYDKYKAPNLKQ